MAKITRLDIEKVLDKKVRPDLNMHGGNIRIDDYDDGVLHVSMTGACSGCPSADLTMEKLVNAEITAAFPEISRVVLVTGVSDDMLAEARRMLDVRHNQTGA